MQIYNSPIFGFHEGGYSILRCTICGLGSTSVDESFDPAQVYSSSSYFQGGHADGYADYIGSEEILRSEFRETLKALRLAGRTSGRLIEIGCAYGFFLSEAQRTFDVSGIEACPAAAAFCRSRELNVHQGLDIERYLDSKDHQDVVVMLDVIEHLPDPLGVMRAVHKNTNPGAHLLITTGDWASMLSRLMGASWRLMTPPQHLFFFSRKTITQLLKRAGFKVLAWERPSKRVPLDLILFQLLRIGGFKPKAFALLKGRSLRVNLFDAMRVIAVREEQISEVLAIG